MKSTKQKEAILAAVCTMRNHPTADEIYVMLRNNFPRLSLGTVYRNLNNFSQQGHIRKVFVPGAGDRFDYRLDEHAHICCEQCGKVFDIDAEVSICPSPKESGVQVTGYKLMLYGVCSQCS